MERNLVFCLVTTLAVGAMCLSARGDDGTAGQWVSREEYESLKQELTAMKAEMATMRQQQRSVPQAETQEYLEYLDEQLESLREGVELARPGTSGFLISGYATAGYTDVEDGISTFSAQLSPVFLWRIGDRLLFESELEFELETEDDEGVTHVALEYANMSYLLNDYVTVGAGKFLTPFGIFGERLHPAWINKLPDAPLPFGHDGIAPMSEIGFFVRGGVPLGKAKGNYAFYLSNGPMLETEGHHVGNLNFGNFEDGNAGKAVGGRIGFLPIPEVEIGYSFQFAQVDPAGFEDVDAFLQAVDVSYVKECDWLGGTIDLRFEWVFSDVEDAVLEDEAGDPLIFVNERNAGYAQVAYRPTQHNNEFINSLEGVFRFDWADQPEGLEESYDEQRYTVGVNYWLNSSTVIKAAYRFDDRDNGAEDVNAFLLQAAMGF